MKRVLLLLTLLLGFITASAETWTPVGQVEWTEGALTGINAGCYSTWNVSVERSDSQPTVFRLQPYSDKKFSNVWDSTTYDNVYVYLHTENRNAIYFEPYLFRSNKGWDGYVYNHIFQRCPENGFDSRYYGAIVAENTIEFPVGTFAVDHNTSSSLSRPSSDARYSTKTHKIVFPDGVLDYIPEEETWVNIGNCYFEDPVWSNLQGEPLNGYTSIEKSVQHPGKYRLPFADIKVYTENPNNVYISPYTREGSNQHHFTVTQMCIENGLNDYKYGTLVNGRIEIPGDYFTVLENETGETSAGSSNRKCVIIFPDGFDNPLPEDNGVFMGIIGFNDEIVRKPISLLNEDTKSDFTDFVDGLQMGDATLLYYAVDQAISSMRSQSFPENLGNAVLITFTDGLDEGSLAMKPEHRTSKGYAEYLSNTISTIAIQGHPLEAYAIGLKSDDVYDDELFLYNLQSLASKDENISTVSDIVEMQQKLTALFENLEKQTSQRIVTIKVPMMSHGDKYRFTLDHSNTDATTSNIWFEGVFNIDNLSLEDIFYHGFTSTSGQTITTKQDGIKLIFSLNDCRDENGNILDVDNDGIDQYRYIPSRDIWNHNKENAKKEDIDIQNIKSSVAIMFALDCSTSLGDLFPLVKSTANTFIDRLAGGDEGAGIENIIIDTYEDIDINDPRVEIYDLQGVRVINPMSGLYICRKGTLTKKILIK